MTNKIIFRTWLIIGLLALNQTGLSQSKNGFDLSESLIRTSRILYGGPEKDAIPAIDNPEFIIGSNSQYMEDKDRILGIVRDGVAKAYPIRVMDWHEVVNDKSDAGSFIVSYCPLCGTGMAFSANVRGRDLKFGVSGLVYNSDVLFYDRATESLWSQIEKRAISGEYAGTTLLLLPLENTTWASWLSRYPNTLLLSNNTGYQRDYFNSPYQGYATSRELFFRVSKRSPLFHPKEQVLGLEINQVFKAYAYSELSKNTRAEFTDRVGGIEVKIIWDGVNQTAIIVNTDTNEIIPSISGYWFAWYTFHNDTLVFMAEE